MDYLLQSFSSYPQQQYLALCLYVITMTGTPGPNNVMLTTSGASFGIQRSLPHIAGIHLGLVSMIGLMALGFNKIFSLYPQSQSILFFAGVTYLVYLAYKIAFAPFIDINKQSQKITNQQMQEHKPMTLIQALLFQYVNPKAWVMTSNVLIFYALSDNLYLASVALIMLTFPMMGFLTSISWVSFGSLIGRFLNTHARWRGFNVTMALLLMACIPLMV